MYIFYNIMSYVVIFDYIIGVIENIVKFFCLH